MTIPSATPITALCLDSLCIEESIWYSTRIYSSGAQPTYIDTYAHMNFIHTHVPYSKNCP